MRAKLVIATGAFLMAHCPAIREQQKQQKMTKIYSQKFEWML